MKETINFLIQIFIVGRIGQFTAKYALGNGMKVVAFDPFLPEVALSIDIAEKKVDVRIKTTDLETLLKNSDYISMHVPMPADKKPIISIYFVILR